MDAFARDINAPGKRTEEWTGGSEMESKKLREVKKGEFFRLRESETAPVWIKTGNWMRQGGKTKYEVARIIAEKLGRISAEDLQ